MGSDGNCQESMKTSSRHTFIWKTASLDEAFMSVKQAGVASPVMTGQIAPARAGWGSVTAR